MGEGEALGLTGHDEYPDDIPLDDYPFDKWVEAFASMEEQRDEKGISNRYYWIQDKLDELGLKYEDERPHNGWARLNEDRYHYTRFTVVPFVDDPAKPAVLFMIPVNDIHDEEDQPYSYATGVVQMLMLALKLRKTEQYVNTCILFLDAEKLEHMDLQIHDFIQHRHLELFTGSIVAPAAMTNMCIDVNGSSAGIAENTFNGLMSAYALDWAVGEFATYSYLIRKADELDYYDSVSVGFGPDDESYEEMTDERSINRAQVDFAKTGDFARLNGLFYQAALYQGDHFKRWGLNTDFRH